VGGAGNTAAGAAGGLLAVAAGWSGVSLVEAVVAGEGAGAAGEEWGLGAVTVLVTARRAAGAGAGVLAAAESLGASTGCAGAGRDAEWAVFRPG